ncbi:sugar ABC transporter ATP-binding protein [Methylorubrum podarium]|jgi:sugar transport system ATP-binding protein|uniref:sugar ABC transporter ATP-binding protein n=1 Tax=Methylorubrum podarium TaxID=200476 RepID=UPI001EE34AC4|nr:sugar ABC transporter ATP-binding protein [Methylorubrum podarium]GJE69193.1 Galactose/methyl galactoside import ATP-binding protein MglA [Methylorubrum podarium]
MTAASSPTLQPVATVRGAHKRYPGVVALDGVDFQIAPGEIRALLGKNGAGKSTLIRCLTGATEPDEGTVAIDGHALTASGAQRTIEAARHGVRAVYQELSLIPSMSIAENLFLGRWPSRAGVLSHDAMDRIGRDTLSSLGLDLDPARRVDTLSPAERQLVEIARVLVGTPKLVILDEPTSSLAAAEVDVLFTAVRRLAAAGIAVIYVSHRMAEIRAIAETATVMRDGRVVATLDVAGASTAEIVGMMLGREDATSAFDARSIADDVVLEVNGVALRPKLDGIDFVLRKGEVLGLAGLLGSGRTELLRVVAGLTAPDRGRVLIDGQDVTAESYRQRVGRGVGFTPESRKDDGIVPLLGVDENVVGTDFGKVSQFGVLSASRIATAASGIVARLGVKAARTDTPIGTLSGGNQQKVVIGRWIYAGSRILLLDEPTRGVDVEAKAQIYAIVRELAASGCSIIFVSSEVEELPQVCDRVLILSGGRLTQSFTAPDIRTEALMAACL